MRNPFHPTTVSTPVTLWFSSFTLSCLHAVTLLPDSFSSLVLFSRSVIFLCLTLGKLWSITFSCLHTFAWLRNVVLPSCSPKHLTSEADSARHFMHLCIFVLCLRLKNHLHPQNNSSQFPHHFLSTFEFFLETRDRPEPKNYSKSR